VPRTDQRSAAAAHPLRNAPSRAAADGTVRGVQQLSFFGAGAQPSEITDLGGLLAGPAQIVRSGAAARLSVVLPDASGDPSWRADALLTVFADCGLGGELAATVDDFAVVRTEFRPELAGLAIQWARGAMKAPPRGFSLTGPRLRLWAIAAGRRDDHGYVLTLGESDEAGWTATGVALGEAGLTASLIGPRAGGPAFRITGQRRLARLRELTGDPPEGSTESDWPPG
jgi:hypothetical protein